MFSFCYHELTYITEEYEETKYLVTDNYMLDEVSDKIKMLIDTNNKLAGEVTLKNVAMFTSCVIKDVYNFYHLIFLEEVLTA